MGSLQIKHISHVAFVQANLIGRGCILLFDSIGGCVTAVEEWERMNKNMLSLILRRPQSVCRVDTCRIMYIPLDITII